MNKIYGSRQISEISTILATALMGLLAGVFLWHTGTEPRVPSYFVAVMRDILVDPLRAIVAIGGTCLIVFAWLLLGHAGDGRPAVRWVHLALTVLVIAGLWWGSRQIPFLQGIQMSSDLFKVAPILLLPILLLPAALAFPDRIWRNIARVPWQALAGGALLACVLFTSAGCEILSVIVICLVALAMGRRLLGHLGLVDNLRAIEILVLALPLGLAGLGLAAFGLGVTGWWYAEVAIGLLALLAWLLRDEFMVIVRPGRWDLVITDVAAFGFLDKTLLAFGLGLTLIAAMGSLAPEVASDATGQHVAIAARMALEHRLAFWPQMVGSVQIAQGSAVYAWATLLSTSVGAKVQNFVFVLMVPLAMCVFARRFLHPRAGIWAWGIWGSACVTGWLAITAYVDIMSAVYALVSVFILYLWRAQLRDNWLIVLGIYLGALLATKFANYTVILPLTAITLALAIRDHLQQPRRFFVASLYLGGGMLAIASPWVLRTYVLTGNPVFPTLNNVFRSPLWEPVNELFGADGLGSGGKDLLTLMRLPWTLVFQGNKFGETGELGPAFLVALPLALVAWLKNRRVGLLALVTVSATLLWVFGIQYLRWFVLYLPLWGLLAGEGIAVLMDENRNARLGSWIPAMTLTLILLGFGGQVISSAWWLWGEGGLGFPFRVVLRDESRETYLHKTAAAYGIIAYLNANYQNPHVWNTAMRDHLHTTVLYDGDARAILPIRQNIALIEQAPTSEQLWQRLRRYGYTHVIIDSNRRTSNVPEALRPRLYSRELIANYLPLEYAERGRYLLRVQSPGESVVPWDSGRNLLESAQVIGGSVQSYRVAVTPGDLYLFTAHARTSIKGQALTTRVTWLDERGRFYQSAAESHWPDESTELYFFAETAPAGARDADWRIDAVDGVELDDIRLVNLTATKAGQP